MKYKKLSECPPTQDGYYWLLCQSEKSGVIACYREGYFDTAPYDEYETVKKILREEPNIKIAGPIVEPKKS